MNKEHLLKILKYGINMPVSDDFFDRLYEPELLQQPIDENKLERYCSKALTFNYKALGFTFISGRISCTGLEITFKSNRFKTISVGVFYDSFEKCIYNSVLAIPMYTGKDWFGKKSINQSARKVKSDKDMIRVLSSLYKRFECPVLN